MKPIQIRLYVKEDTEVFEMISPLDDKLVSRISNPLGTSFVDLLYCNSSQVYDDIARAGSLLKEIQDKDYSRQLFDNYAEKEKAQLIKAGKADFDLKGEIDALSHLSDSFLNTHVFYSVYSMFLNDILLDYTEKGKPIADQEILSESRFSATTMKKSVEAFIFNCLDISIDKAIPMHARFEQFIKTLKGKDIQFKIPASEYDFYPEKRYGDTQFKNNEPKLCQVVYPKTMEDIVYYLMVQQLNHETRYNQCKNCGKYFVLSGYKNAEYCDRPIDDTDKTCKDIGAITTYRKRKEQDPVYLTYNKAYKTKNARIRYGKITREMFAEWSKNARIMRDKCQNHEITLEQFVYWLESDAGFHGVIEIK